MNLFRTDSDSSSSGTSDLDESSEETIEVAIGEPSDHYAQIYMGNILLVQKKEKASIAERLWCVF